MQSSKLQFGDFGSGFGDGFGDGLVSGVNDLVIDHSAAPNAAAPPKAAPDSANPGFKQNKVRGASPRFASAPPLPPLLCLRARSRCAPCVGLSVCLGVTVACYSRWRATKRGATS
eukprot:3225625-Pyramimonas_sp.AAC.1